MKLAELAALLKGTIHGDLQTEITGACGLDDAGPGDVSYLADRRYVSRARTSRASCILVGEVLPDLPCAQIEVADPALAFARVLALLHPEPLPTPGVHERASVAPDAVLGESVFVGPGAVLLPGARVGAGSVVHAGAVVGEGVVVGRDCVLHPGSVLCRGVRLGDRVVVHANAVLGADGFGYLQRDGKNVKVPQVGGVRVDDDVEIGACSTVDRATVGDTVIGRGSKIDNLVQIAHNVRIGQDVVVAAQGGIGGSATIGSRVMFGGRAAVADHVSVADGTVVAGGGGVAGDIAEPGVYSGVPAIPHRTWRRAVAVFARLPEMMRRLSRIERHLNLTQGGRDDDGH